MSESYNMLQSNEWEQFKPDDEHSVTIPVGTIVYRADCTGPREPSINYPSWFADKQTATIYSGRSEANFTRYKLTKSIRLFVMNYNSLFYFVMNHMQDFKDDDLIVLLHFAPFLFSELQFTDEAADPYPRLRKSLDLFEALEMPFVNPLDYITMKDVTTNLYINRRMADIICRMNYDGWIVYPFNPAKKQGMLVLTPSLLKAGLKVPLTPYDSEILVCKWWDVMERIPMPTVAQSKTRKRKRVHA